MTPDSLARFIAEHDPAACVEIAADALTVCSVWTKPGTRFWGWTVQRIQATEEAVRDWLGY